MCVQKSCLQIKVYLHGAEANTKANFYRPQRSCKGYVFTPVCLSVHRGDLGADPPPPGVDPLLGADNPPRSRYPPLEQTPPGADLSPPTQHTATVVDGTHPSGMHSCFSDFYPCSM